MRSCFFILCLMSSCIQPVEYSSSADYFVVNSGAQVVLVNTEMLHSDIALTDTVAPFDTAYIYTAREGSGGHIYPTNFFGSFRVYVVGQTADSMIYEGVHNNDWTKTPIGQGVFKLFFKAGY